MVPDFMKSIKTFYLETYKDQFFIETPPFFEFFMWTEVFFQGPLMLWSIGGLLRGEANFNAIARMDSEISSFLPDDFQSIFTLPLIP
jgi:hypothetical protein